VLALGAALGLDAVASAAPLNAALDAAARASAPGAPSTASTALPVAGKALPSALSVGKWLVLGMVAGSVSSAGYWVSQGPTPRTPPERSGEVPAQKKYDAPRALRAAPPPQASPEPAQLAPRAVAATEAAVPPARSSSSTQAPPAAELAPPAPLPAERPQPADARLDGALERETRLVDEARQAIAARDASRAATLLDQYDATRALGVLDREALLLRVELSLARGDQQGARALAARFAQRYPTDAHLVRLRALLSAPAAGGPALK
jgi:hypothetical protein